MVDRLRWRKNRVEKYQRSVEIQITLICHTIFVHFKIFELRPNDEILNDLRKRECSHRRIDWLLFSNTEATDERCFLVFTVFLFHTRSVRTSLLSESQVASTRFVSAPAMFLATTESMGSLCMRLHIIIWFSVERALFRSILSKCKREGEKATRSSRPVSNIIPKLRCIHCAIVLLATAAMACGV